MSELTWEQEQDINDYLAWQIDHDWQTKGHTIMLQSTLRQNKIDTILACFEALKRGVRNPVIIRQEDSTFSCIPGAYLKDTSYSGSKVVVTEVDIDDFGDLDLDNADDATLQTAAEWAADEWDWAAHDAWS